MKKSNTPALRFPEFKDCGEWEEKTLGEVVTSLEYGMNAAATVFDGINKYIRITDIDDETGNYLSSKPVSPQGDLSAKYLVHHNDILFARTGASTGKTYLYKKTDGKLYFAGFLIRGSVKESYNSFFIYELTQRNEYRQWIASVSMRSGQPGVNVPQYSSYSFSLPTLPEQQKIADCLSSLDTSIDAHTKKFDLLKEYKKGLLQKLFPKEGQKIPEYRFPEFKDGGEWEEKTLGEVCELSSGGTPSSGNRHYYTDGTFPWLKSEVCKNGIVTKSSTFINALGLEKSSAKMLRSETTLIATVGATIGKVAYITFEASTNQNIAALYPKEVDKLNPKFLFYSSLLLYPIFRQLSDNFTMASLSFIKGLAIFIPTLQEQKEIADCLSTIDKKIEAQAAKLTSLKEHKKGLMQGLFPVGGK